MIYTQDNSHRLMQLEISARVLSMMIQVVKVRSDCAYLVDPCMYMSRHLINALSLEMLLGYVIIVICSC